MLLLQFNERASAINLTLIHESCPAGFEIVKGIIPGQYLCQCSKNADLKIQSCDETTEDVLLKVRGCVYDVGCWLLIIAFLQHSSLAVSMSFSPQHILLTLYILFPPHQLSCVLFIFPMQDWLWGHPIANSDGTKDLFTTGCSRGYCRCQLWYTDNEAECRFTVSQDLAQRDQQCTCNRQGT